MNKETFNSAFEIWRNKNRALLPHNIDFYKTSFAREVSALKQPPPVAVKPFYKHISRLIDTKDEQ